MHLIGLFIEMQKIKNKKPMMMLLNWTLWLQAAPWKLKTSTLTLGKCPYLNSLSFDSIINRGYKQIRVNVLQMYTTCVMVLNQTGGVLVTHVDNVSVLCACRQYVGGPVGTQ